LSGLITLVPSGPVGTTKNEQPKIEKKGDLIDDLIDLSDIGAPEKKEPSKPADTYSSPESISPELSSWNSYDQPPPTQYGLSFNPSGAQQYGMTPMQNGMNHMGMMPGHQGGMMLGQPGGGMMPMYGQAYGGAMMGTPGGQRMNMMGGYQMGMMQPGYPGMVPNNQWGGMKN
jgi:hypothetical protein